MEKKLEVNKDNDSTTSGKTRILNSVIDSDSEEDNKLKVKSNTLKTINTSLGSERIQKSIRHSDNDEGPSQKSHIAEGSFIGHRKVRAIIESDSDDDSIVQNVPEGKSDNLVSKEDSVQSDLSSFASADELSDSKEQNDNADNVHNISAKLNNTKLDIGKKIFKNSKVLV